MVCKDNSRLEKEELAVSALPETVPETFLKAGLVRIGSRRTMLGEQWSGAVRDPPTVWRKVPKQKEAVAAAGKPKWHAVEVLAPRTSCPAAQALKGKRFLSTEAPLLPLPQCTRSGICACVYRKYPDRRAEERREGDDTAIRRSAIPSPDRRTKRGRRKSD
jgi:hypothetical protein